MVVERGDTAEPNARREHQTSRRLTDDLTNYTSDTLLLHCAFRKLEEEDSGVLKHCTDLVISSFGSLSKLLPRISFMSVTHDRLSGRLWGVWCVIRLLLFPLMRFNIYVQTLIVSMHQKGVVSLPSPPAPLTRPLRLSSCASCSWHTHTHTHTQARTDRQTRTHQGKGRPVPARHKFSIGKLQEQVFNPTFYKAAARGESPLSSSTW